jgi:hypothetical protein
MAAEPIPDRPVAFGYKQHWFAARDSRPGDVAVALGLEDIRPSSWKEGIDRAYDSGYDPARGSHQKWVEMFVSPPIRGWTLAVGGIRAIPSAGMPEWAPFLQELSRNLGQIQYFGTHRVSGYVAWAKAERGHIIRAYGWADETLVSLGALTPEEVELGFDFLDETRATPAAMAEHQAKVDAEQARLEALQAEIAALEAEAEARGEVWDGSVCDDPRFESRLALLLPDEDSVMMLAGRWSLDPTRLEEYPAEPGLGLLGSIQTRWP